MLTKAFALDAGERAGKTFIQSLAAVLAVAVPTGLLGWEGALSAAVVAAVMSLATSIVSQAVTGDPASASLKPPKPATNPLSTGVASLTAIPVTVTPTEPPAAPTQTPPEPAP